MLYLVRHGDTDANDSEIFDGWAPYCLNSLGRAQSEQTGEWFSSKGVHRIVCSDICRAHETAKIIAARLGLQVIENPLLRPINVGDFTGERKRDVWESFKPYIESQILPIPGGESAASFNRRANRAVNQYDDGVTTILVAHNSTLIAAVGAPYSPDEDENDDIVSPGGVIVIGSRGNPIVLFEPSILPAGKNPTSYGVGRTRQ